MARDSWGKGQLSKVSIKTMAFLGLASVSLGMFGTSVVEGTNDEYPYEGISFVSDTMGGMCVSSVQPCMISGSIMGGDFESIDFIPKRERKSIKIQVTKISKHVSKFDFEDEYEEI